MQVEIPYADQLELFKKQLILSRKHRWLLPIKTRDETDIYIKYPIEFSKIVPAYTEKIPSNAYETGGIYQYVLMDVEENPTVKLVDLTISRANTGIEFRKKY